jgi:ketosteroid isomerase-like protein/quercetin dioxygenase-like cupin family protein
MIRVKPFYLVAAAIAAACATTPRVDVASEESAIRAINRQMEQAVASKNVDAVVRLYADDAVLMPPNMPPARGPAAIRAFWTESINLSNASLSLAPMKIDVATSGELATDVGAYTFSFRGDQGPVNDRGKYMVKFRKVGTDWKISSDIFNSDIPMPPPPVAVVVVEPAGEDMTMNAAAGMSFQPLEVPGFKSGMQLAVLHGDPGSKGDYTIRLRFPAGYRFPAHYHPNAEHLTVLSGTFLLSMGATESGTLREYQPGDFLYIPPRKPHFGGAKTETVIQLHGIGPFEIKLAGVTE